MTKAKKQQLKMDKIKQLPITVTGTIKGEPKAMEFLQELYIQSGKGRAKEFEFHFARPWWLPRFLFSRLFKIVVKRK